MKKTLDIRINVELGEDEKQKLLHSIDLRQWTAVRQQILEQIELAGQEVSDPKSAKDLGTLAGAAGAFSALRWLLVTLEYARVEGGKTKDPEES